MTERLRRALGLSDAVFIGLASMIGAGIFAAVGPATDAAEDLLLVSLLVAGVVAFGNATSSAQLAARTPEAGGTYVYGRERLGEGWGYLAGWAFVVGKTASCAALARTFAVYAAPGAGRVAVGALAAGAALALTAVNLRGVERTARASRALVVVVLAALALALASSWGVQAPPPPRFLIPRPTVGPSAFDVLRGAGLLFFAFAGYARIATLGEEVRDPERTIPRAIPLALGITLVVYALVAETTRQALGTHALAASTAPVADAVAAGRFPALAWAARAGAIVASLGVLLSLLAGVSRTTLAMARTGDLPRALAHIRPGRSVPDRAEVVVGVAVATLAALVDLRDAIGFSAFTVLLYYAITNVAALRMQREERRWPRALALLGLAGCLTLAFTLPVGSILAGAAVLLAGRLWFELSGR